MSEETQMSTWAAHQSLMLLFYNTSPRKVMETLFPNSHEAYIAEKLAVLERGVPSFWGALDYNNQLRLSRLAENLFGEEARGRERFYTLREQRECS